MAKKRLDVLLVEKGLCASRERAKTTLMAGCVQVDGQRQDKPGTLVSETAVTTVAGDPIGFVSRGGLKLAKAVASFVIDLTDKRMIDVGASTGGFTDCALQNGASNVVAVDVGYGQLAWKLRTDPRVMNLERTNIRFLTLEQAGGTPFDFASVDVSFISLTKVLPIVAALLKDGAEAVVLIKPQFEAGRADVGKKGVVRDPAVHERVIAKVLEAATENDLRPCGLTFSPVKGPEGNIEYLLYLKKAADEQPLPDAAAVVAQAHQALD